MKYKLGIPILKKATLASAALFAASALFAQALDFDPIAPRIVSARLEGFGGGYAAIEAGFDTLNTNPAAFAYTKPAWSFARLSMEVSGPLFDLPSAFKADDTTAELLDLVAANNGIYFGADVTGPIAFGKVDRNFGFGFFNRSLVVANAASITSATIYVGEEFLLTGGYGLEVYAKGPHAISAGLQLKGFFQVFIHQDGTAFDVFDSLTSLDVNGLPSVLSTGFGVDAGFLYRYGENLNVGVVCRDLFTPVFSTGYAGIDAFLDGSSNTDTNYDRLPVDLSVGVAYAYPLPDHWATITGLTFMADYRDILCFVDPVYRNPFLNVAIGAEIEFLNVVSVRAGLREAYLSAGLGLDLSICKIDLAMYGTEGGLEPGNRPILNIAFSIAAEY